MHDMLGFSPQDYRTMGHTARMLKIKYHLGARSFIVVLPPTLTNLSRLIADLALKISNSKHSYHHQICARRLCQCRAPQETFPPVTVCCINVEYLRLDRTTGSAAWDFRSAFAKAFLAL